MTLGERALSISILYQHKAVFREATFITWSDNLIYSLLLKAQSFIHRQQYSFRDFCWSVNTIFFFYQSLTNLFNNLDPLLKATRAKTEKLVSIEVFLWEVVRVCCVISVGWMAFTSLPSH